jgi:hypothetical protein
MDCLLLGAEFKLFQTYINFAPLISVFVQGGGKFEHLQFYIKYHLASGQPGKVFAQPWASSWYTYTELVSLGLNSNLTFESEAAVPAFLPRSNVSCGDCTWCSVCRRRVVLERKYPHVF